MTAFEERLRTALRARVDAFDEPVPPVVPHPRPQLPRVRRAPRLRTATIAAVLVAAMAAVGLLVAEGDDPARRPGIDVVAGPPSEAPAPPVAPAVVRVVVDAPGVKAVRVDEIVSPPTGPPAGPGIDGFHMQSFRSAAGFEGPMLWVLTVPPPGHEPNDYGFGLGRRVTVQGRPAHVQGDAGLRLTWPAADGGGVILTSWGMAERDLLAVAEGLRPRPAGWEATVLPGGLAPVIDSSRAAGQHVTGGRRVEGTYRDGSGRSVSLSVSDAGPVTFEDRASAGHEARTFEAVAVAGRPGLMTQTGGDGSRWSVLWQPTPTMVAELRLDPAARDDVVNGDDVRAALASVRVVDEQQWRSMLPASTVRPEDLPATAASLWAGTHLPAGATWSDSAVVPAARDRAALASEVMNHALCAWQREWLAAKDGGDEARAERAVVALDRAGAWPISAVANPGGQLSRGRNIATQLRGDVASARDYVARGCP